MFVSEELVRSFLNSPTPGLCALAYFCISGVLNIVWQLVQRELSPERVAEQHKDDMLYKYFFAFFTGGFLLPMSLGLMAISLIGHFLMTLVNRIESNEAS